MVAWAMIILKVVNSLFYLVVLALWLIIPEQLTLNISALAFTLSLTVLLILREWGWWSGYFRSRRFKMVISRLGSAFLLFCVLAMINYLAFKNPLHWDITRQKINSLTEQSRKVVASLVGSLKVTIFSRKGELHIAKNLLNLYRYEKRDLDMEFVDMELRPDLVKHHDIVQSPTILLEHGGKKRYAKGVSELNVTNALIALSRKESPLVYYTTGHGEVSLDSQESGGGSTLAKLIRRASWELRPIDLNNISEIPSNASALMVWGPQNSFFDQEIELIDRFLKKGGRLLVALSPSFKGDPSAKLRKYLSAWGVRIRNNVIIDQLKYVNGSRGSVPIVHQLESKHPVTRELEPPIFFPLASSVEADKILAHSSPFPGSWADNTPGEFVKGAVTYGAKEDIKGPVGYVGIGQKEGAKGVVLAYGNASFVSNAYKNFPRNFMLFLNSLSWLVDEDHLTSLSNTVIKDSPVFVGAVGMGVIFYFSVLLAPLILFILAVVIYRSRLEL